MAEQPGVVFYLQVDGILDRHSEEPEAAESLRKGQDRWCADASSGVQTDLQIYPRRAQGMVSVS